jgi:hypothetical protein
VRWRGALSGCRHLAVLNIQNTRHTLHWLHHGSTSHCNHHRAHLHTNHTHNTYAPAGGGHDQRREALPRHLRGVRAGCMM